MPKENKTADIKKYQAEYRASHPKNSDDVNEYMKGYIKKAVDVECPVCKAAGTPGHFKSYAMYKHNATSKHQKAEVILEAKNELAKRQKQEEEAQEKALAEAEAKKKRSIKLKIKKKAEEKNGVVGAQPLKEEEKKHIRPPKRVFKKKAEEAKNGVVGAQPLKEEKPKEKPVPAPRKPKEKPAALKALEEYSSSSSSESESETEEEQKLEKETFRLQSKKIDASEVAEYIKKHFEESANPDRSSATKTKRTNKDASLWKKVSAELDGMTFKQLGERFGEIVSKAYEKPTSQADFISMLKRVIVHFTKLPKPEEMRMNALARKLKESHTKAST